MNQHLRGVEHEDAVAPAADPPVPAEPAPTEGPTSAPATSDPRHRLTTFGTRYAVVGIWLAVAALYGVLMPDIFPRVSTLQSILGSQQAMVFLGLGALVAFVVGEFDLSIASTLGLSATLVPVLSVTHGVNLFLSCVTAVVVAALVGLLNGVLVVKVGVGALIVTLGMATFLLGIAALISHSQTVAGLTPGFSKIALTEILGLPISFYYGLILAALMAYILTMTPLGRHMSFVGANPEVARLAGVRVERIKILSFVVGSAIAGLGGVILVASVGGYDSTVSANYILPTFAAVFLGTAVVRPGQFNALGTLVAIYFLATGIIGLQMLGYSGWVENVFYGAALVLAVSVATTIRRRGAGG
ncbi:ABC transporter permease [Nocardioides sp.]|uniref:ABC transporter permease n=1 Tax=Nocardioides sp. TaxID=35761 RepID=UPI0039E2647A